jgi:hypothetical protein
MADSKISGLTLAEALTGAELIPIVQGGATVHVALTDLAAWVKTAQSIVPANIPYRGARVKLAADYTPSGTGFVVMPWGAEDRDTDDIWAIAAPTRLVVPSGVTKVSLSAYIRSPNGPSGRYAFFKKNGAYFIGGGGIGSSGQSYDLNMATSVISVVPGDYFELELFGSASLVGAGLSDGLGTWFELAVREYS